MTYPETIAAWFSSLLHKTFRHASPSQIKAHRACARRWWFEKIGGVPTPVRSFLSRGKTLHTEAENYLLSCKSPSPTIAVGVRYLPKPPVPADTVERSFALYHPDWPVLIVGYIDLIEPRHRTHAPDGRIVVGRNTDHKTTGNLAYMITFWDLETDPQSIVYSLATGPEIQGTYTRTDQVYTDDKGNPYPIYTVVPLEHPIEFRHVYYLTDPRKSPRAEQVRAIVQPGEPEIAALGVELRIMAADAEQTDPGCVTPNLDHCGDYGGCPFIAWCHVLGEPVVWRAIGALGARS